jgi:Fe-S-cluster containining protein
MKSKAKKIEVTYQPNCGACESRCCRHIATQLDTPKTKTDYDHIRWFLMHTGVRVGQDLEGAWLLEFPTLCRHLKNNRCSAYSRRPRICSDYPPKDQCCENETTQSAYKILFTTHHQFERWLGSKKIDWRFSGNKRGADKASKKIPSLTIEALARQSRNQRLAQKAKT